MFNKEDDYSNATKHAKVNTHENNKSSNLKLVIFNFILVLILGLVTFFYLESQSNVLLDTSKKKEGVLGVSEVVDNSDLSDAVLMNIIKPDSNEINADIPAQPQNSMKVLMSQPSIQSQTSYTEEIARELDDKSGFRGKVVVVNDAEKL